MSNNLELIIDSREQRLYEDITSRDLDVYTNKVNILYKTIDLGDIHIIYNDI